MHKPSENNRTIQNDLLKSETHSPNFQNEKSTSLVLNPDLRIVNKYM